jgi:chemotaxis protein MotB
VFRSLWLVLAALLLASCGYSEDEWQAQLAKYNQLNAKYQKSEEEREQLLKDLAAAQAQVAKLKKDLAQMGVSLEQVNAQLQTAGTEKARLAASLDELRRALEEYKKRAEALERIKKQFEALRDKLKKLTDLGLKVEIRNNRMVIRLPGDVLFASGQDKLQDKGKQVLDAVAKVIREDPDLSKRYYQVAGHTDSKQLKGPPFYDNWGLSLMRARQVLVYLIGAMDAKGGGGGLDATRLHPAGYGETDPVASNDSDDGRQQNRRVELVVLPNVEEMLSLQSMM